MGRTALHLVEGRPGDAGRLPAIARGSHTIADPSPVVDAYGWQDNALTCAHPYILPALLDILRRLAPERILDLGCGNGALTHELIRAGYDAVGCDADAGGIEIARRPGGDFRVASVYDDPAELGENGFSAVVSVEVVEHLFTPRSLPRYARAVLRDGGHLVLTTPYHGYLKNLALSVLDRWDKHLDPFWDGGHVKLWSRVTLTRLLEEEGFDVLDFRGVGRLPYLWKSMILVGRKRSSIATSSAGANNG